MDAKLIQTYLSQTQIMRSPRKTLSTFGATQIEYQLVSPVEDLDNRTRLRTGIVVSLKPKILTAESFLERFEGFGEEAAPFARWLSAFVTYCATIHKQGFTTRRLSVPPP